MYFSYFDIDSVTEGVIKNGVKKLEKYRAKVQKVVEKNDDSQPEYSLVHAQNPTVHDQLDEIVKKYKGIKHLIVIGIGGSNLGLEAVHSVLGENKVTLHTLDTVSAVELQQLINSLSSVKSVQKLAVCVISKSGNTAETLVNAGVLLDLLEQKYQKAIYQQTIFIGSSGTDFMKTGKRLGVTCVPMPENVGGRYSVATEVGLVPLALLGYDVDAFIAGVLDATHEEFESVVAENAARINHYLGKNFRHYNFFAFEKRLDKMGAWYRQLTAESLGKEFDNDKKPVTKGFVPTISTPVELHSAGQLYMSGFSGVYTDFVTFDDEENNFKIPKKGISKPYGRYNMQEIATALYGGVMAAYQERTLPYRSTIFDDGNLAYSTGLFMNMRMLETMYIAQLINVNAFNQPNVELYKNKTREILDLK
jgi:glucose-6-phosphate isomerase